MVGDLDGALALNERALALNPNLATAWYSSGTVRAFRGGEPDLAIEHLARAMRLSPLDPLLGMTAFAHFFAGRYDEACTILGTLRVAAVSYAFAGRFAEARKAVARALELDPQICLSNLKDRIGVFRRPQDYAKYAKACAWRDYLNSGEHLIRIRYISFIAERRG